jgi:hypothetical protein
MRITAFVRNEKAQVMFSIVFELLILGMVGTILLWISNTFIIQNPSIPIFRLISSLASILILTLFNINNTFNRYHFRKIAFI